MKNFRYSDVSPTTFFISKIKKEGCFLVIANGYENPFKYIEFINRILINEFDYNNKNLVYFDLLAYRGFYNRFVKATLLNKTINIANTVYVDVKFLPNSVRHCLTKFYSSHLNEILSNSDLSEFDKNLIYKF